MFSILRDDSDRLPFDRSAVTGLPREFVSSRGTKLYHEIYNLRDVVLMVTVFPRSRCEKYKMINGGYNG